MAKRAQIVMTAGLVTLGAISLLALGQWQRDVDAETMPESYEQAGESNPSHWPYVIKATRRARSRVDRLQVILGNAAQSAARFRHYLATTPGELGRVSADPTLDAALHRVLDGEGRVRVGLFAVDLQDGSVVASHSPDALLVPASNQKVVTAAAALGLLGPEYSFQTWFSELDDTLYVRGEGDPSLDNKRLGQLAEFLGAHRLAMAAGPYTRIVFDDSAFAEARVAPGFGDDELGLSYLAPSGALSLEFNTAMVVIYQSGAATGVRVSPDSSAVSVVNRARLDASTTSLGVRRRPLGRYGTQYTVSGKLARGRVESVRRSVVDPGAFTAGALAVQLAEQFDAQPPTIERGPSPAQALPVVTEVSPPLIDLVGGMLTFSNNFVAEQLVRTLGYRLTPFAGDWAEGTEILRAYLSAIGIDPFQLEFNNGSGMNREGRASARSLAQVLALAELLSDPGSSLASALPIAGVDGTLRTRLRDTGGRVRAKTGTMDGISGLSGYVAGADGRPRVAFSVLVNAKPGEVISADARRRIEDAFARELMAWIDRGPTAAAAAAAIANNPG